MGGICFTVITLSVSSQSYQPAAKDYNNNRFYELREQLMQLEVDFAKFYKKPKKGLGNRLRRDLDGLKYSIESVQKEIYELQQKKRLKGQALVK